MGVKFQVIACRPTGSCCQHHVHARSAAELYFSALLPARSCFRGGSVRPQQSDICPGVMPGPLSDQRRKGFGKQLKRRHMLLKELRDFRRRPNSRFLWLLDRPPSSDRAAADTAIAALSGVHTRPLGDFSRSQSAMPDCQQVAALLPLQKAHLRLCRPFVLFKFPTQRYLDCEDQAVAVRVQGWSTLRRRDGPANFPKSSCMYGPLQDLGVLHCSAKQDNTFMIAL